MPYNIHEQPRKSNLPPLSDAGLTPAQIRRNHLELEMLMYRQRRKKGVKSKPYNYKTNETYFNNQKKLEYL